MFACIPLLLMALFTYTLHRIVNEQVQKSREMELTKNEGIIDHYYTKNGYEKYYIRFNVNGETVVKEAVGYHCGETGYKPGVHVPIGYHVDEKGIITVFIDDKHLEGNKNREKRNLFLYASFFLVGLAIICALKTLLRG